VRPFLLIGLTPLLLVASIAAAAGLLHAGWSPPVVVGVVNAVVALSIAVLERVLPHRPAWNRSHGDVKNDVLHMVFAMLPVPVLFRAVALSGLTAASVYLATRVGHSLWPSYWSLAAQLLLALVVAELGQYWVHRLAHERALLWRLHSVHHSVERLYWLNAGRFHPLDTLLQHGSEIAPLILLGANAEVLALYTVFTSANGLLRHANIEMRVGVLSWVLSTADLHRWHHSREVEESNANYGANLILWDIVFGTRRSARSASPEVLGLQSKDFPRTFLAQLAAPFRSR
jgi:ornithine lipid hydroxylase